MTPFQQCSDRMDLYLEGSSNAASYLISHAKTPGSEKRPAHCPAYGDRNFMKSDLQFQTVVPSPQIFKGVRELTLCLYGTGRKKYDIDSRSCGYRETGSVLFTNCAFIDIS